VGVTSDWARRTWQHRTDAVDGFTRRNAIHDLVWYASHAALHDAIAREKTIKRCRWAWKVALIERGNAEWRGLFHRSCRQKQRDPGVRRDDGPERIAGSRQNRVAQHSGHGGDGRWPWNAECRDLFTSIASFAYRRGGHFPTRHPGARRDPAAALALHPVRDEATLRLSALEPLSGHCTSA
jgi:putative endonuclease